MNYYIRISEISIIFLKITYLWHIMVATAFSDINNEQHITKNWGWHILVMKYFTLGPIAPGRVKTDPPQVNFDPGSIFFYIFTKKNSIDSIFCVLLTLTLLEGKQEPFIDD